MLDVVHVLMMKSRIISWIKTFAIVKLLDHGPKILESCKYSDPKTFDPSEDLLPAPNLSSRFQIGVM